MYRTGWDVPAEGEAESEALVNVGAVEESVLGEESTLCPGSHHRSIDCCTTTRLGGGYVKRRRCAAANINVGTMVNSCIACAPR